MKTVLDSGDLRTCYPSNRMWTINADAVTKDLEPSGMVSRP